MSTHSPGTSPDRTRQGGSGSRRTRVPEGPQAAPPAQKLRIRYSRRGRLRYTSVRDFQRALERALRRAGVPVAFSSGFHPHPRISYASAAPTGTASEAEYAEISVTERLDPEAVRKALDAALPEGYGIEQVVEASPGSLADLLEASLWRLEFADLGDEEAGRLRHAVQTFLAAERAEVTRALKKGPRTYDTRGPVLRAELEIGSGPCAILDMVVRHATPVVRPEDVLTAMRTATGQPLPRPHLVTRLAQGPLEPATASVRDPLSAQDADGSGDGDA